VIRANDLWRNGLIEWFSNHATVFHLTFKNRITQKLWNIYSCFHSNRNTSFTFVTQLFIARPIESQAQLIQFLKSEQTILVKDENMHGIIRIDGDLNERTIRQTYQRVKIYSYSTRLRKWPVVIGMMQSGLPSMHFVCVYFTGGAHWNPPKSNRLDWQKTDN
jgi:hypothetical protein